VSSSPAGRPERGPREAGPGSKGARWRRAALLLLAALASGRALPAGGGWQLVATRRFEHRVCHAGFLDERTGLTVGAAGAGNMAAVFSTRDGGETWIEGPSVSWRLHVLELLPDGFAWHAGTLTVSRSFNGGRSWYRVGSFGDGGPALFLSFADENRGLIASPERLGRTEDGGLHWTAVPLPPGAEELAAVSMALVPRPPGDASPSPVAIHAVRPVAVRALDSAGRLWRAEEGGAGWRGAESPLAGLRFRRSGNAPAVALRFTPAGEGVLAAFVEEAGGWRCRVWRTAGGAAWAEEPFPPLPEPGTLFLSPDGRFLTWRSADRDELRVYATR
jgi:hypothetical protein